MDHPLPIPQFLHDGDFLSVLKSHGYEVAPRLAEAAAKFQHEMGKGGIATEGTTVLAVKYKDGVLLAGDRRATAGNLVMYERAEKLITIDARSILAIAGVPAVAFEMARVLEHSFKYYHRSQLQEMSTAGKVRTLSKLLKENLPLTLQGVGMVVPIFATHEQADGKDGGGKVYFYDALGAQFEGVDYAASGSGSIAVRSVLHYLVAVARHRCRQRYRHERIQSQIQHLPTRPRHHQGRHPRDSRNGIEPGVQERSVNAKRLSPSEGRGCG
jgi:proteasome beta subunit